MFPRTRPRTPIPLILLLLGCGDDPTAPVAAPAQMPEDLAFTFAEVDPDRLVSYEHVVMQPPTDAPALSEEWGEELPASSSVMDARTVVGIGSYGAYAYGLHRYTGNVGRVETTLEVAVEDRHLGSRTGVRQQSGLFLLDFGRIKDIIVHVRLYTDRPCGLEAHAQSRHSAWWEFYQGTGADSWGRTAVSSQAAPARSGPCGHRWDSEDPTGSYDEREGYSCTYLITYDLDTGQIYDAELLYCTRGTLM